MKYKVHILSYCILLAIMDALHEVDDSYRNHDYSNFDADEYCRTFYGGINSSVFPPGQQNYLMSCLSDIFNSGEIKGSTLLDFGTGPTIYNLISASRHFPNIYVSDFSENNRNALWRWLTKQPDSHDFSDFFEFVVRKENLSEPWQCLEDDMRSRIKGILASDMTLENPLSPCMFPQFDVISSSLCLDTAPGKTITAYETVVKNVVSLLKPDGWFVYIDALGYGEYHFGKYRFDTHKLTKEGVMKAWKEAGCEPKAWMPYYRYKSETHVDNCQHDGNEAVFCMTAQKASLI